VLLATFPRVIDSNHLPENASPVNKSPLLSGIEGKHVKIADRIEMYRGKPEIRINAAEQLEVE
jgi:DNA/RNA endonuclease YhcR with UshA esterase domain